MDHSKEELLSAVNTVIETDAGFAKELQTAIDTKRKSLLRQLVEGALKAVAAVASTKMINWLVSYFFDGKK